MCDRNNFGNTWQTICEGPKETNFCCAWFPKAPNGDISLLENNNQTTYNLPRNTPQTLLALRKATGPATANVSALGGGRSLLIPQSHNKVFLKHIIDISGALLSPELQAYLSNSSCTFSQRYPVDSYNPTSPMPGSPPSCCMLSLPVPTVPHLCRVQQCPPTRKDAQVKNLGVISTIPHFPSDALLSPMPLNRVSSYFGNDFKF